MSEEQFEDLREQAAELGHTAEAVALLEEAVRLADSQGDVHGAFEARSELVEAAIFSGFHERAVVAFSWMLSQVDQRPEEFYGSHILWQYKWILGNISHFPQIPRRRILDMLDDFERRLQEHGHGRRSAHSLRMQNALGMGDLQEAERRLSEWLACPRDSLADCAACELNNHIELLAALERDEEALHKADPILNGRQRCAEVPHDTYGHLMRPLIRLGAADLARLHHKVGYRMVSGNHTFVDTIAEHLLFLTLDRNYAAGAKLVERHLGWAAETADWNGRFRFYLSASLFLSQASEAGKSLEVSTFAPALPEAPPEATADAGALACWLGEQTLLLARRFDQRNENDYFSQLIEKSRRLAI